MEMSITRKVTLGLLLFFIIVPPILYWTASYPSVAMERDSEGSFQTVEGGSYRNWNVAAGFQHSKTGGGKHVRATKFTDIPLRLSSATIVDLSGTRLSRRVAYEFMNELMEAPEIQRVDVQTAGDLLESSRLGELLFVIEELEHKAFGIGVIEHASASYEVSAGHIPDRSWDPLRGTRTSARLNMNTQTSSTYIGTPFGATHKLAKSIAAQLDASEALATFREQEDPAPNPPAFMIPAQVDLAGFSRVAKATGLAPEPTFAGSRIGREGEAFWRYAGNDAHDMIERAVETLRREGWSNVEGGNRGASGRTERAFLRKGNVMAEWIYEKNRTSPEILWVHVWRDTPEDELRAQWEEAQQGGPEVVSAFLANLAVPQRHLIEDPDKFDLNQSEK
tara:strand:+ start:828 stop:2003 length:1176 start_codon:yes stop_codon:yes gene_type:complete